MRFQTYPNNLPKWIGSCYFATVLKLGRSWLYDTKRQPAFHIYSTHELWYYNTIYINIIHDIYEYVLYSKIIYRYHI